MSFYYHICLFLLVLVCTSSFLRHNHVYRKIRVPRLSPIKTTLIDDSSSTTGFIYGLNGEDLVWNNLRRDAKAGTVQYCCLSCHTVVSVW